jgi:hypothetical protein
VIPDGRTKDSAVIVLADWHDQDTRNWYGQVMPFLVARCPVCGRRDALAGPGRHACSGCGLWMLYVPKVIEYQKT